MICNFSYLRLRKIVQKKGTGTGRPFFFYQDAVQGSNRGQGHLKGYRYCSRPTYTKSAMTTPAPRQRRGSVMGPARQSGGEQKLEREESLRRGSLSTQIEGIDAPVDRKGIEKAMYAYGLFLGKFWKIALPIVICALAFMLSGWHKAKWSDMPMEKLWSTRGGYLESEWDYYEANEVKRWRKSMINVFATDQRDMGPETNTTGRAGDVLNVSCLQTARICRPPRSATSLASAPSEAHANRFIPPCSSPSSLLAPSPLRRRPSWKIGSPSTSCTMSWR